jgi:hypothetical protein
VKIVVSTRAIVMAVVSAWPDVHGEAFTTIFTTAARRSG